MTGLVQGVRHATVARTVAELAAMLGSEGGTLALGAVDERTGTVDLSFSLDDADCGDNCALPPDQLRQVVETRLRSVLPGLTTLRIDDSRQPDSAGAGGIAGGSRVAPAGPAPSSISVLDPTGGVVPGDADPGPDLGSLRGRRVGVRVDVLWQAWDQTVDEWITGLERAGAIVTTWRRAQGLKGAEGERKQAEYDAFVGGVDAVISGLANCGSCTSWSVKDGLNALNRGLPTVVAATEHFVGLARTLAADNGRPGLRLVELPSSLNTLPEEQVRAHARSSFPALLDAIGAVVR
jgi:Fe-S cluster biogenesis protein NfuA